MRCSDLSGPCKCSRLRLESADIDRRGHLRWVFKLTDERLLGGWTLLHVETSPLGHPLGSIKHTTTSGLHWMDPPAEFDGIGLPLADPELRERLEDAIEDELRRVDLARLLLSGRPPRALTRIT